MRKLPFLILGFLVGCSAGPDYDAPEAPDWQPEQWQAQGGTAAAQADLDWWRQFDDPMLDRLVEQAITDNLSILAAQERVKLAQSYREAVSATSLPQVSLGAGYAAGQLSEQGPIGGPLLNPSVGGQPLGFPLADRQLDATFLGLGVAWEPDLFGKTASMIEASDARAEQVAIIADGTRLMVVGGVVSNYLQLRSAQSQKALLRAQLEDLNQIKPRVESLQKHGLTSSIESDQIDAQVAAVSALLTQLDTVFEVHGRRLAILLSLPSSSLLEELSTVQPMPQITDVIPVGLPSELLQRRPDIRLAERQMKVANAELGVAIANRYPSFYLTGAPGVVSSDFSDLFSSGSTAWSFGAGMNWALFDGGLREAMQAVAESQVNIAALDYQRTLLSAFSEVETLLSAYGYSSQNLAALTRSRDQVARAVQRTGSLVDSGLAGTVDLLKAQASLHQANGALLLAQSQHAQLVVAIYKSLGGSWSETQAQGANPTG
ncbi:efflux transporter outer membrane subunit [Ferrimonas balearica]|uniref:efflux transporter outer membrane subunit n=1 Tax=Ferrimonas balearica TaxID=44012 RepID=UPI001C99DB2A|nr:efflux transporter outer membrane subunit [Ferrimonas balearica]MBY5991799.1 efflux transporter outer membrane subunit [Ferrimonas balearica]